MDIEILLNRWADYLLKTEIGLGYPSTTVGYKFKGASHPTVIPIPHYWPDQDIRHITEIVTEMPMTLRNPIIGRYYFRYNIQRLSKICGCTRTTVRKRLETAKSLLEDRLCEFS